MEMFTLKRSTSAWLACCRACGHEQALPTTATSGDDSAGINISCERCPSEEAYFTVPGIGIQTSADANVV